MVWIALASLGAGVAAGTFIQRCKAQRTRRAANQKDQAFVLIVNAELKPGSKDSFLESFRPLASFVDKEESGCLAYKLSFGEKNPNQLIIYERYISKEYLEEVHWKSKAFEKFKSDCAEKNVEWITKEAVMYWETEVGFMI